MKKGVSPVIATVLLISLIVFLAGIIYYWNIGFLGELFGTKNSLSAEKKCEKIDYGVTMYKNSGQYEFEIVNRAEFDVDFFQVDFKYDNGQNSIFSLDGVLAGESSTRAITFDLLEGNVNKTLVYPAFLKVGRLRGPENLQVCIGNSRTIPSSLI